MNCPVIFFETFRVIEKNNTRRVHLTGIVTGHETFADGSLLTTSPVFYYDEDKGTIVTKTRSIYQIVVPDFMKKKFELFVKALDSCNQAIGGPL